MIVVISPEQAYPDETYWVNRLLDAGQPYFHIRKPGFSKTDLEEYLMRIDNRHRNKLVLHQHYALALGYGIDKIHIPEYLRLQNNDVSTYANMSFSTSVHTMSDFNNLTHIWHYAFISPIFESISKPGYGRDSTLLHQLADRTNYNTQLIALGGITPQNKTLLESKADGVALSGAIWHSDHPLKTWEQCRK